MSKKSTVILGNLGYRAGYHDGLKDGRSGNMARQGLDSEHYRQGYRRGYHEGAQTESIPGHRDQV